MVKNGSTAVIGGIYQLDNVDTSKGIPFLRDIPFIGRLFKQTTEQKTKNELLLFLKPKILKHRLGSSMMSKSENQILLEDSDEPNQSDKTLDDEIPEGFNLEEKSGENNFPDDLDL